MDPLYATVFYVRVQVKVRWKARSQYSSNTGDGNDH